MSCSRTDYERERERKTEEIEAILRKYLPPREGMQSVIMEAMEYSLMAGGKRLRPMLMRETYLLFGGEGNLVEPFMAAMEMIHTYSLVHDDLPAMDNDEYRRGRKTTHVVYGEDMGILAGDALLNFAFETAASAFEQYPDKALLIGKALRVLAGKAGIYGMIGGQVVDVKETGHAVSREDRGPHRELHDDRSHPGRRFGRGCEEGGEDCLQCGVCLPGTGRYPGRDQHQRGAGKAGTQR